MGGCCMLMILAFGHVGELCAGLYGMAHSNRIKRFSGRRVCSSILLTHSSTSSTRQCHPSIHIHLWGALTRFSLIELLLYTPTLQTEWPRRRETGAVADEAHSSSFIRPRINSIANDEIRIAWGVMMSICGRLLAELELLTLWANRCRCCYWSSSLPFYPLATCGAHLAVYWLCFVLLLKRRIFQSQGINAPLSVFPLWFKRNPPLRCRGF